MHICHPLGNIDLSTIRQSRYLGNEDENVPSKEEDRK